MKLKDKTIIVTGSTMGIGEAIARSVVEEGGKVLIHGLEEALGRALVADLGTEYAALHIDDLQHPEAPTRVVEAAVKAFGSIDGLVNNAAVVLRGDLESTDADFWDKVLAVNVRAPFLLIKSVMPHLEASGGSVVNIGSVNAYCGEETLVPYSVSKGGLQTLTRNLGDTLHRRGVRVNQVNPGWVLTPQEQKRREEMGMPSDWAAQISNQFAPAGRLIQPQEIAATVVHFLSDAIGPVSGAIVDLEQHPMIGRNPMKDI